MSSSLLMAAAVLNGSPTPPPPTLPTIDSQTPILKTNFSPETSPRTQTPLFPESTPIPQAPITPEFSPPPLNFTPAPAPIQQTYQPPAIPTYLPELPRPKTGSQLLSQRVAALQAGVTYTRIPTDSFMESWQQADLRDPTYDQWQSLLIQEAKALAYGQGNNSLSVIVGDSLSMWFPADKLSKNNLWLNQGISGENTTQILRRLKYRDFAQTKPTRIYVMAGVNDLRQGASDQTILATHRQIMRQLQRDYPQSQIIVQSILPTRFASIPDRRLRYLNQQLEIITAQERVSFLNLYNVFLNQEGQLRRELTTDGIHLSMAGYDLWSWAINQPEFELRNHVEPS